MGNSIAGAIDGAADRRLNGETMVARRCWISGRVQGVFYRGSVAERARALALRGSAVNHSDGRVEVRVVGEAGAVEQLIEFLWIGPSAARVTGVEVEPIDSDSNEWPQGFVTG